MIHELRAAEFPLASQLFHGHNQHVPVSAIIEGNFPGRIFVDNVNRPKTALVWAISRWAYVGGNPDCNTFNQGLYDLIKHTIIPDTQSIKMNWLEIYSIESPAWMKTIDSCLSELIHSIHYESIYIWNKLKFRKFRTGYKYPVDVEIKKVDTPIISESAQNAKFVQEKFKARTSVAFNLISKGKCVAQCRSDGFESGKRFMVEVNTYDENNRGRGYATAAGVGLMDYCLKNDLEPLWETTEDNIASQKLALKLGFTEDETYPVFAITF